jgi:mannose-6-phosphate isomerase-like protein (cupin superfamily)
MARLFTLAQSKELGLPGRNSREILSGLHGARSVTLRIVEVPVSMPGDPPRPPHFHPEVEECIFVLSGKGITYADSGEFPLAAGDTLLVPPGEKHVTRNIGGEPLLLLCFFPVAHLTQPAGESAPAKVSPGP